GRGRRSPATPRRWRCPQGSPAELPARRRTDPATWSARRQRRANAGGDCGDRGAAVSGLLESRTPERRDSAPGARRRSSVARRSACAAWSPPKRDVTKSKVMRQRSGAVLEAPALVPGLDDVAMVGEAIEQRGGHFWVAEHSRPFAEGEIGGDQDRGTLVEPADEVEEELSAGQGERQVAEFVEDDEVHAGVAHDLASLADVAELLGQFE